MKIQNDRTERSKEAFKNPLPGDYWNEMFCPYFVILAKTKNDTLIVCDKTKPVGTTHWTWDLEKVIEVSMDYMNRVKYDTIDGFCADVSSSPHRWVVTAWEEMGSPYTPLPGFTPNYEADFRTVMEQGL